MGTVTQAPPATSTLLSVEDLRTYFYTSDGVSRAVDGVSFQVPRGKTLGIVGESGCGKSVTAMTILRLIPEPPGKVVSGRLLFNDQNLLDLRPREMRRIRGNKISMIFQEPMTSLNPVFTIGEQIAEVFRLHRGMGRREAWDNAVRMLDIVRIPAPRQRVGEYPHQLSGGMRQRAMIAMALACDPELLIADEPTTALDVTVQAQILQLMEDLKTKFDSSIMMITHDLGVIAEICDEVVVMYAGQIVEHAGVHSLFANPRHPYTQGLLQSIPKLSEIRENRKLEPIRGNVPDPTHHPAGCRFHPRCPHVRDECKAAPVAMRLAAAGHQARCVLVDGEALPENPAPTA
ncbi:MAG: ABC transporter ATP-binding protein [Candidatus Sumerlaeia bacterium]|nr:ABC transporter ATP-binding protein [Candidatus Sumerlaeia bacterium]